MRVSLLSVGALCATLCVACASPSKPEFSQKPADRTAPELGGGASVAPNPPDVLAYVAGEPLTTSAFLGRLLHRESRTVFDTIDRQVTSRLALMEAQRLGIKLDPALVDAAFAADSESMRTVLANAGYEVDRYLLEELGLDPGRYFELMRDEVVEQLMTERVMRAWLLSNARVTLRVIVTDDAEAMQAALLRLEAGEDFAAVAESVSVDPSGQDGGRLPPMVQSELSPMVRLAFRTTVGEVGGPVEQDGRQILLMPVQLDPALTGNWAAIGEQVEADLLATPSGDPEYWQWRSAMGRRYQVDLSPLLELAGEPLLDEDA